MRRVLGLLVLAIGIGPGQAAAQKFYPDDPLLQRADAPAGARSRAAQSQRAARGDVGHIGPPGRAASRQGQVIAAQGVNTLGEVLDGAWYVEPSRPHAA